MQGKHQASHSQQKLAVLAPIDVLPFLPHHTSSHQPWDLSGFTVALRAKLLLLPK